MRYPFALTWTLLALMPAVAAAQVEVDQAPEANRWLPLLIMVVIGLGVIVGSFLGSRRGHRD